jgi:tetratricopeptide (TPR) repeat protein
MYSTNQFRVFPSNPTDRLLSRPRRLLQEGRITESEAMYRELLTAHPELAPAYAEYFSLLRSAGRHDEALRLAERAAAHPGMSVMSMVLRGAALVELGRYREGLRALDEAAQLEPDLSLVWHETGYAAWRLGELSRALMALDRAFALEPHGSTLLLRGRVLRQAGRYLAAEVSFEGAAQAAEFAPQRVEAEREIQVTRRHAAFPNSKPDKLPGTRRWFAETGAVPLVGSEGDAPSEPELASALAQLATELEWEFDLLVALDGWAGWYDLAEQLRLPVAAEFPSNPQITPLVAIRRTTATPAWADVAARMDQGGRGLSFTLHQDPAAPAADICGDLGDRFTGAVDLGFATEAALHPEGLLHNRELRPATSSSRQ